MYRWYVLHLCLYSIYLHQRASTWRFYLFLTVVFYLTEIYVELLLPCLLILQCTVPVRPSRYLPVNKFTFLLWKVPVRIICLLHRPLSVLVHVQNFSLMGFVYWIGTLFYLFWLTKYHRATNAAVAGWFRFEHSSRLHKKITTRVHFPELLDMTPFISNARNTSASSGDNGATGSSGGEKKDYQFIPRLAVG